MKRLEYFGIAGMTLLIVWLLQGLIVLQPGTVSSRLPAQDWSRLSEPPDSNYTARPLSPP